MMCNSMLSGRLWLRMREQQLEDVVSLLRLALVAHCAFQGPACDGHITNATKSL
jgi:hypothetical protein